MFPSKNPCFQLNTYDSKLSPLVSKFTTVFPNSDSCFQLNFVSKFSFRVNYYRTLGYAWSNFKVKFVKKYFTNCEFILTIIIVIIEKFDLDICPRLINHSKSFHFSNSTPWHRAQYILYCI